MFGGDLFGEPAWDILLDLFIAAKEGKRISITSACIGAAAPSTTSLRWLNILEREQLIEREGDSNDLRRSYVRLTGAGYAKMIEYFSEGSLGGSADKDLKDQKTSSDLRATFSSRGAVGKASTAHPE